MIESAGASPGAVRPASGSGWGKHFNGRVLLEVLIVLLVVEFLQYLVSGSTAGMLLFEPIMRVLTYPFRSGNMTWGGREVVGIFLVFVFVRIVDAGDAKAMARDLGLAPPVRSLVPALALFVPLAVAAVLMASAVPDPYQGWSSPQHYAALIVGAFSVELLYRGYFFGHLVKHAGWRWPAAAVLTSVLFDLIYFAEQLYGPFAEEMKLPSVTSLALSFVVSFLLCGAYVFTQGNLYACVGLRLAWLLTRHPPAAGRIPLYAGAALALVICVVWFGVVRRALPKLTDQTS